MTESVSFWQSESALKYEDFSIAIPSDIPAYKVVYDLLNPAGKSILDFGCFQGKSSQRLLQEGASEVLGVDSVENNIVVARKSYLANKNLGFLYVDENSILSVDERFDATCMTFVHPTIASLDKFKFQIKKIYDVMKANGILVLLGLHPNSFENYEFLFYGHQLLAEARDGAPFANELKLLNGETLKFTDYFWTTETLTRILEEKGFAVDQIHGLQEDLKGRVGEVLRKSIGELNFPWKDEWKAPLYQVIVGRKI
jgi:2-polyprenyl-3-methyl-5-hydroxy-6-metoxy-1,4-benzoquinol methylase